MDNEVKEKLMQLIKQDGTPVYYSDKSPLLLDGNKTLSENFMDEVNKVRAECDKHMRWLLIELMDVLQEKEELEIELMMVQNEPMPEWKRKVCAQELNFKRTR